ncbi:GtrA family protein [Variovorax paradoxus]|uniref:GtrA-like protein n=1 Tax=Variovorax paradoxus TaxID=34073 RepID=A0A0H2M705_VARPD|nr:GtrA family protein [Variovorax paradoxus]KLN58234.1 GtrA-like protein [Variovorax paradoxus]
MKLGRQFLSFAVVGVIGLVVDVAVLYLMAPLLGWYGARVVSFLTAATTTWAFNRRYTFAARASAEGAIWREYLGYLVTMLAGAVLNYGAYVLTLHWVEGRWAAALGVAIGSIAGMGANFLSARYLVFRSR